ncbi:MAG: hypothetical protein ATN35_11220 [Epulopiscium sp. Nele67-Bin004]|nr:MAG: hypothetical protein ATN35_11220 [Epulopiscium sp. Nele67-Bin004]
MEIIKDYTMIFTSASLFTSMYHYLCARFCGYILESEKQKTQCFIYAITNTIAYFLVFFLELSHYWYYFIGGTLYISQLKLMGASFRIALGIASHFIFNLATVFIAYIGIFSYSYNVSPQFAFYDPNMRLDIIFFTYFTLLLIEMSTYKKIGLANIKTILNQGKYTNLLPILAIILTLPMGFDEYIVIIDASYNSQVYILCISSFLNIVLYYTVLHHTVDSTNIASYRAQNDITKIYYDNLKTRSQAIMTKANQDELTLLYNKTYIMNYTSDAIIEVAKLDKTHGVIFVDINGLKFVNDTYGHEAGDRLIKRVSNAINKSIRDRSDDRAGRIGGDELLLVISNITSDKLHSVAERIKHSISVENDMESMFHVSASMGTLHITPDIAQHGLDYVLQQVDINMRLDKEQFYKEMEIDL